MADPALVQQLAAVGLFSTLPPKVLRHLADAGERQRFDPGEAVTTQGESVTGLAAFSRHGAYFHLVLDGSAEVLRDGRPVGMVGPGEYVGELSLLDDEPRSADVVAGRDGLSTFALDRWVFGTLLDQHPEVARQLLAVVVKRLRRAEGGGYE